MDSAEHASVQPVAEFQHFQRHYYRPHVLCAAPRMPLCPLSNWPYKPTACAAVYPAPSPPARMSHSWYASLWTRQNAQVFNQPLSLDTSKVTRMNDVFWVRLRACPCHPLTSRVLPARYRGCHPNALPSPGPPCRPHGILPLDSAACASVQPAAEFRHVKRHEHKLHVSGALRACSCHPVTSRVLPARYLGCYPNALPSPGPPYRPHSMPPFGLGRARRRSTSR